MKLRFLNRTQNQGAVMANQLPAGYAYLTDDQGNYLVDDQGNYIIIQIASQ